SFDNYLIGIDSIKIELIKLICCDWLIFDDLRGLVQFWLMQILVHQMPQQKN
ncbi:4392_t:CDS:1, partial [Funneliformis mosseae]